MPLHCRDQVGEAHRIAAVSGRSTTFFSSMTVPSEEVFGSSSGAPPTHFDRVADLPDLESYRHGDRRSTSTMIPSRRNVLKPVIVASSE